VAQALWNGAVLADSNECQEVEGNLYFPSHALRSEYFRNSETTTICTWKGTAHYFNIVVDGKVNLDAAWYYPDTKSAADLIKGYVGFWRGVQIRRD